MVTLTMRAPSIKPLQNCIVCEHLIETQTESGFVLPDSFAKRDDPLRREVYKVRVLVTGPGKLDKDGKLWPMATKPGDIALATSNGWEFREGGKDYWLLPEEMICAILERESYEQAPEHLHE